MYSTSIIMPVYNKLIRDKIPEIIERDGKEFNVRTLSDKEFHKELYRKLHEEVTELQEAETSQGRLEELVDIYELMMYLVHEEGSSIEELDHMRREKKNIRGGFDKKLLLIDVED